MSKVVYREGVVLIKVKRKFFGKTLGEAIIVGKDQIGTIKTGLIVVHNE